LILTRAEASWFTGNKQAAIDDINIIRTVSGGVAPLTLADLPSDAKFIDELIYERRYSMLFEYGHMLPAATKCIRTRLSRLMSALRETIFMLPPARR
jgi:hypothetical protein